jgi:hypothetical protein
MRLILCSLVVLAWTVGPFYGPKAPTLSAPLAPTPAVETPAPAIDFDSLHTQAREALDQLRQAQAARRMTVASASSF